jgi:hypothetical protein
VFLLQDFHLIQGNLSSTQIRERLKSTGTLRDIEGGSPGAVPRGSQPGSLGKIHFEIWEN